MASITPLQINEVLTTFGITHSVTRSSDLAMPEHEGVPIRWTGPLDWTTKLDYWIDLSPNFRRCMQTYY